MSRIISIGLRTAFVMLAVIFLISTANASQATAAQPAGQNNVIEKPANDPVRSFLDPNHTYLPTIFSTRIVLPNEEYSVIAWNDLGMHCYNRDFADLAVLPPYNTLWAQVIRRGSPPAVITTGITVSYSFPDNTYSVGKSNFWTYAEALFGVALAPNIGLTGRGLSGTMRAEEDHFIAEGIPLTEYSDSNPTIPDPYQLAQVVVRNDAGDILAQTRVVAPVSTEMRCDRCHSDGAFDITTGKVETNILTLHDQENAEEYPAGHDTPLMQRRPVLCAECHSSNAIGAPGVPGIPNLSKAMHSKHSDKVTQDTDGCYNCHPGPTTKCLRDVMSTQHGMGCVDCHGTMEKVKENANPWLSEPRCDTCHNQGGYQQDNALYRFSKGHGGIYCEGCHDSTHAIAPSSNEKDGLKFLDLTGHPGPLVCTGCHDHDPTSGGPHQ